MKIGVISDIHSNIYAFKACMEYLEKENCDEYIFLGDYISDTPYPRETMDMLYEVIDTHKCHLLRGNREDYMLEQRKLRKDIEGSDAVDNSESAKYLWKANSASGNLLFTYERLVDRDFDFFESLPISFKFEAEGYPSITCAHGSPDNTRQLLQLDGEEVRNWINKIDTDYLLCAHTHYPGFREYRNGKIYINSGCVGISIKDNGFAQCMILHGSYDKWKPEFLKIPYDVNPIVADMFKSGLYDMGHWFINSNIQILLTGIDNAAKLVEMAMTMMQEFNLEKVEWPNIEERYFEEAARIIGVPEYKYMSHRFLN